MQRAGMNATGAEEWVCPDCGHRLEIQLRPVWRIQVLTPGNTRATHCGGLAGTAMAPSPVADKLHPFAASENQGSGGASPDDDRGHDWLRPWLKALKALEDEGLDLTGF
ncbi:MAG: hypothetical protein NZU74_04650 [Chloroflexaceae bacterium]|nr:hypothetical protein [Chloroflexaceae bacterium]